MGKLLPFHTNKPGAKKYIVFSGGSVMTFPKTKVHKLEAMLHGGKPVSAGFFYKNKNGVHIIGHSDSLQLKPKVGDKKKLEEILNK